MSKPTDGQAEALKAVRQFHSANEILTRCGKDGEYIVLMAEWLTRQRQAAVAEAKPEIERAAKLEMINWFLRSLAGLGAPIPDPLHPSPPSCRLPLEPRP